MSFPQDAPRDFCVFLGFPKTRSAALGFHSYAHPDLNLGEWGGGLSPGTTSPENNLWKNLAQPKPNVLISVSLTEGMST